ncbi:uncharacterized protein LOC143549851 [Bidens hawaiensis]|uniref:uncharacterized protein LOC143549851 n=1 Tax=Bidens hawaiensis TaxID=980011 RepID=UPI004049D49F
MDKDASMEEGKVSRHVFEFVKPFSNFKDNAGYTTNNEDYEKDRYTLITEPDEFQQGIYDKPLPCFGCGVGWFSFLVGFAFPLMWYYATFLYFGNYYQRDPRERAGLAASAIAAMGFSLVLLIIAAILIF